MKGFPGGSAGKKSTCNTEDPSSISGSGRSTGKGTGSTSVLLGFPCGSADKESACNVGDLGLIPGLGRSPGEGKGYALQHSGLENSIDCMVHGVAKSRTRLSDIRFHCFSTIYLAFIIHPSPTHLLSHLPIHLWVMYHNCCGNGFSMLSTGALTYTGSILVKHSVM